MYEKKNVRNKELHFSVIHIKKYDQGENTNMKKITIKVIFIYDGHK